MITEERWTELRAEANTHFRGQPNYGPGYTPQVAAKIEQIVELAVAGRVEVAKHGTSAAILYGAKLDKLWKELDAICNIKRYKKDYKVMLKMVELEADRRG